MVAGIPGVTIANVFSSGVTSESGLTAGYSFVLDTQPTDPVTLNFSLSDSTEASLDTTSFTFTPENWNIPQILTIRGLDDFDNDGNISYTISTRVSSIDPDYGARVDGTGGVQVPNLQLVNFDDNQDADLTLYGDLGGPGNDVLQGLNGKDRLYGQLGRDRLRGGRNDDRIYGGLDDDSLFGEDGNDQLFGEQDDDYLEGGNGNDRLTGGEGADSLIGGAGNDTYVIDDEFDQIEDRGLASDVDSVLIRANLSAFTLGAGIENASLAGTFTAASLTGNNLSNSLTGNDNNNVINGAAGADQMSGGLGNDIYFVDNTSDALIEGASSGTADIVNSTVSLSLAANLEVLALSGNGNLNGTGNAASNILLGNTGSNVLNGGSGADSLVGGLGNDIYVVDTPNDVVSEAAGAGADQINSLVSIAALAANIETLQLLGNAPINGTGNADPNSLLGNNAANILNGGAGGDTMAGGGGNDVYVVDNPGDVLAEQAAGGTDQVNSFITLSLTANLEALQLLGNAAINGTGNAARNVLSGNAASNVLNGGAGADTMAGGGGNDVYVVDNPGDVITEPGSGGVDRINSTISLTLAVNIETLSLIGSAPINGTGNAAANTLIGNGATNILDGGSGGRDQLTGQAGADLFRFSSKPSSFLSADADRITDFNSGQGDRLQINRAAFGISDTNDTLTTVTSADGQDEALDTSVLLVYNSTSGELLWNQNSAEPTAGSGGVLAVLTNKPALTSADIQLV